MIVLFRSEILRKIATDVLKTEDSQILNENEPVKFLIEITNGKWTIL